MESGNFWMHLADRLAILWKSPEYFTGDQLSVIWNLPFEKFQLLAFIFSRWDIFFPVLTLVFKLISNNNLSPAQLRGNMEEVYNPRDISRYVQKVARKVKNTCQTHTILEIQMEIIHRLNIYRKKDRSITHHMISEFERHVKWEADTHLQDNPHGIQDKQILNLLLVMSPEKLALIYEVVAELSYEQLVAVHSTPLRILQKIEGEISELSPRDIQKWGVMVQTKKTVQEKIHATLSSVSVKKLQLKEWNIIKNSWNLRISKHTLEAVLEYVSSWKSIEQLQEYSSSFYHAYTKLVENGKLAEILLYLKIDLCKNIQLNKNFIKRSRIYAQKLIQQIRNKYGWEKLIPQVW